MAGMQIPDILSPLRSSPIVYLIKLGRPSAQKSPSEAFQLIRHVVLVPRFRSEDHSTSQAMKCSLFEG